MREKLEAVGAVLGAMAAGLVALLKYRSQIGWLSRRMIDRVRRGGRIADTVVRLDENLTHVSEVLAEMHYQLHPNGGGSLKDEVRAIREDVGFLLEVHNISYRVLPYPAFRCRADGRNTFVSEAYQRLLGLRSDVDLEAMNWMGYLHCADVESYCEAFRVASENESNFRRAVRFQSSQNEPVGRWMVEAHRLRDGSYIGRLRPDDELAREIADANGWEG